MNKHRRDSEALVEAFNKIFETTDPIEERGGWWDKTVAKSPVSKMFGRVSQRAQGRVTAQKDTQEMLNRFHQTLGRNKQPVDAEDLKGFIANQIPGLNTEQLPTLSQLTGMLELKQVEQIMPGVVDDILDYRAKGGKQQPQPQPQPEPEKKQDPEPEKEQDPEPEEKTEEPQGGEPSEPQQVKSVVSRLMNTGGFDMSAEDKALLNSYKTKLRDRYTANPNQPQYRIGGGVRLTANQMRALINSSTIYDMLPILEHVFKQSETHDIIRPGFMSPNWGKF